MHLVQPPSTCDKILLEIAVEYCYNGGPPKKDQPYYLEVFRLIPLLDCPTLPSIMPPRRRGLEACALVQRNTDDQQRSQCT